MHKSQCHECGWCLSLEIIEDLATTCPDTSGDKNRKTYLCLSAFIGGLGKSQNETLPECVNDVINKKNCVTVVNIKLLIFIRNRVKFSAAMTGTLNGYIHQPLKIMMMIAPTER